MVSEMISERTEAEYFSALIQKKEVKQSDSVL